MSLRSSRPLNSLSYFIDFRIENFVVLLLFFLVILILIVHDCTRLWESTVDDGVRSSPCTQHEVLLGYGGVLRRGTTFSVSLYHRRGCTFRVQNPRLVPVLQNGCSVRVELVSPKLESEGNFPSKTTMGT